MRFPLPRILRFTPLLLAIGLAGVLPPSQAEARPRSQRVKPAAQSLQRQPTAKLNRRLFNAATPDNTSILIVLSRQRVYLLVDGRVAIDSPTSTGKRAGMTPTGRYKVTQKSPNHRSNLYGAFVDKQGRVVRAGVSSRIDSAPSGTRFAGAPMNWFLRFNGAIGMHEGHLPGYPASHGCVRLPGNIAPLFFQKSKLGTPVEVIQ